MKAEEFRLGNLIFYHIEDKFDEHKEWDEVSPIDYSDLRVLVIYEDNSEYKPIPLTEEWLLKFGFEKRKKLLGLLVFSKSGFDLYFVNGKWEFYVMGSSCILTEIEYVHQLQNLYWCLCGEELEINL